MSTAHPRPIVFIHGLGSAASYWDNVRSAFDDRETVALDLPGHGPTARRLRDDEARPRALAEAIAAELDARSIEDPHLVGLSLGGWVVLELAAMGRAASVTALAPAGLWRAGAKIRRERIESTGRHALVPFRPLLPVVARVGVIRHLGLATNVVHPERVSAAQFAAAALALSQAQGYEPCDRAAVTYRFEGRDEISVPVTVAFGARDKVLPATTSQERTLVPDHADWIVVDDCGHAMTFDRRDRCVEIISATIKRASELAR
jgi:pimeloyl-ACP methyl ester carboxylesterase